MTSLSNRLIDLSPKMVYEIASGLEEPLEIVKRYNISPKEWRSLEKRPEVQNAIALAKSDMEKSGVTFKNKARLMADAMLKDLFRNAMRDDVPVKDKAQALQTVGKYAGLETSPAAGQQGGGFSITISIPAPSSAPVESVIEVKPVEKEEPKALENHDA